VAVELGTGVSVVGVVLQARATVRDASGVVLSDRIVTWATSAPSVASVTQNGAVTAVGPGTAIITASAEGKRGSETLLVVPPPPLYMAPAGVPVVQNGFIVIFDDTVSNPVAKASQLATELQATVSQVYSGAIKGFAGIIPSASLPILLTRPGVQFVESDKVLEQPLVTPSGVHLVQQQPPNWGLDRIDQRSRVLDGEYTYGPSGNGVTVYIVDTGVLGSHSEFDGRMLPPAVFVTPADDPSWSAGASCRASHATEVAGIVGGKKYGVAKSVQLLSVQIYPNCDGSRFIDRYRESDLVGAILWITNLHPPRSVANLSSRYSYDAEFPAAVLTLRRSVASGVTWVLAVGNEDIDACRNPLVTVSEAVRVGASGPNDTRWKDSNWGSCVDIFAPGEGITTSSNRSATDEITMNGTSIAAPFVAGVAALLLEDDPTATPQAVKARILAGATKESLSLADGSPNLLLFSGLGTRVPTITLSTQTAMFSATVGSVNPPTQNSISVSNGGTGTLSGLSVGTIIHVGVPPVAWLSASLNSNTAPANVSLTVTSNQLAAGSYTALVPITSSAQFVTNSPRTITVMLSVAPAPQVATIVASPNNPSFTTTSGGDLPPPLDVAITNGGAGTLAGLARGTITYGQGEPTGWLGTATLSDITAPATLMLQPNTTNLPVGTYHATVPIRATGNVSNSPLNLPVTYTITPAPPPGPLPPPSIIAPGSIASPGPILNTLTPTFSWNTVLGATGYGLYIRDLTIDQLVYPNASGTVITPLTGASFVLPGGILVSGRRYRWAMTSFNGPTESTSQSGLLYFQTEAAPLPAPTIDLSAATANFAATAGGANPPSQNSIQVTNSGTGTLSGLSVGSITYQAGEPTGWLTASLSSTTAPATVTLAAVTGALPAGTYTAFVPIVSAAPFVTNSPLTITATFTVTAATPQFNQQGPKLVGTGAVGSIVQQGASVALSADGNTAIAGGYWDNFEVGAAWIWTRSGGTWIQQGPKLVGTGEAGTAHQGTSVALSADGNTAIIGGPHDNGGTGAAWIWIRTGGTWSQQGPKLVGSGVEGFSLQGVSVALSADGNTAIIGGYADSVTGTGAAWVFVRNGGVWTQQGAKLVGSGAIGASAQGNSVGLSADGNTAIVGGLYDNGELGAAWIWTRGAGIWTQQGGKLVGTGAVGKANQGWAVGLSGDGNTAIVGGALDDNDRGAAWVWTRSGGIWTQQSSKLVGAGASGSARQGSAVSISTDGNIAIVGGVRDNSEAGAAWVWARSSGTWSQLGTKLTGTGAVGLAWQGNSVSLSGDGSTAIVGGPQDSFQAGAVWVFSRIAGAIQGNTLGLDSPPPLECRPGAGHLGPTVVPRAASCASIR